MLPIVWLSAARRNLTAIIGFIAEHNPSAARRIKSLIEDAVLPLAGHPYLSRTGRVAGTRELLEEAEVRRYPRRSRFERPHQRARR